jgi:hypothetical protein
MWCIAKLTREFRRRMYRILDLYNLPYNPLQPVVCVDEKSKQLISDKRQPIRMSEGKVEKVDYEYKRNGTRNIFVAVEPKAGKHFIEVTRARAKADFAKFIATLVDDIYLHAEKIIVVLDNLNTHFVKSFYETFSRQKADKLLERVEFCYTPKHASWLNMAEIEISMLEEECIGRRIGTENQLIDETNEWVRQVNQEKRKINWGYTKRDAYKKLSKHYVS